MTAAAPRHVAIIGSGPSGLYAADALIRAAPDSIIDVYDRLPTPFGLIRSGVAPDHPGTKAVVRQFEKLFQRPNVHFMGHVEIGRDVSLDALRRAYDLVFIAAGAPVDRRLAIRGEDLTGVHGSAAITGWYNGHPDWSNLAPAIGERVVIVGMGNVALDIARILTRNPGDLAATDIAADALAWLQESPVRQVVVAARRGPVDAGFTATEMAALSALADVSLHVDADIPADTGDAAVDRRLAVLRHQSNSMGTRSIRLCFDRKPLEIIGNGRVEAIEWQDSSSGRIWREPCDTVITAIGYRAQAIERVPLIDGRADCGEDARIAPGLYALGWFRRGASGTIATNRQEAQAVVRNALEAATGTRAGERDALIRALRAGGTRIIDWQGWKRIENRERDAPGGHRKMSGWRDLLRTADFA